MPFYEYLCKSCGHTLEAMQKINDAPLKKCPHCGKSQLTRLMSAPVFRLKGGGWYETDFKGEGDNKKNLADRPETDAAKDAKPAADAKTDATAKDAAKPAEKAADKPAEKAAPAESKKPDGGGGMSKRGATAAAKPAARAKSSAARPKRAPPKKAAKSKSRR
jgi:putative FmdB family regulatory protein